MTNVDLTRARAYWITPDTIAWGVPPDSAVALHWSANGSLAVAADGVRGGTDVPLTNDPTGLAPESRARFPHLAGLAAFRVPALDVSTALKGQLVVSAKRGGELLDATALQLPGVIDYIYRYDGPLGVTFERGVPTLRVWAPTARAVTLWIDGPMPMSLDRATGVWSITGDATWANRYYLYEVEVFVRSTGRIERNLVTDPYSLSLARNSARSQIVDLSAASLKPDGWDKLRKPRLEAFTDIALYELHVRDFSLSDPSVPAEQRGTFKAFTNPGTNGMKHLAALAAAGLTHVHLLPAFDFASVNEDKSQWKSPGDLTELGPDSDQQQEAVMAVADYDGFNWGYDPLHYTVPEGSYATDGNGWRRIVEFREMVQGLASVGLRTVMDVVYNHTFMAGQHERSVLDRIVPDYYHRLDADGKVTTSTCCPNTASEHAMMEKLLVDSVLTWAKQYKIDGFRFDLMGHHMKRNMLKVRAALDALTPAAGGVDGRKIYVYGEGWNFGEVVNNIRGENATQHNMAGTGIGTFSDRLRDGIRGGSAFADPREQGFISGLFLDPNALWQGPPAEQKKKLLEQQDWIRLGVAGNLAAFRFVNRYGSIARGDQLEYNGQAAGYAIDPHEIVNYIEAHDNDTLFDGLQCKLPVTLPMAQRVRAQNLGVAIVALSQGVPLFHAGMDMLRSKSGDRNSFNSGDWFNRLDFTYETNNWAVGLPPQRENGAHWPTLRPLLANPALRPSKDDILAAVANLRETLAIRKSSPLFRLRSGADVLRCLTLLNGGPSPTPGLIVVAIRDEDGSIDREHELVVALFNAAPVSQSYTGSMFAGRGLTLHPIQMASQDAIVRTSSFDDGTFTIPGRTAAVFWQQRR